MGNINWNYILRAIDCRLQQLEQAKGVYTLKNDMAILEIRKQNLEAIEEEIKIYEKERRKVLVEQQKRQ